MKVVFLSKSLIWTRVNFTEWAYVCTPPLSLKSCPTKPMTMLPPGSQLGHAISGILFCLGSLRRSLHPAGLWVITTAKGANRIQLYTCIFHAFQDMLFFNSDVLCFNVLCDSSLVENLYLYLIYIWHIFITWFYTNYSIFQESISFPNLTNKVKYRFWEQNMFLDHTLSA